MQREKIATIILAAGKNIRLKKLCFDRSKVLLSVNGQALIERLLIQFEDVSSRIVVVTSRHANQIRSILPPSKKVLVVENPALEELGNSDSLKFGIGSIDIDYDKLCIVEGDILIADNALKNFWNESAPNKFIALDKQLTQSDDKIVYHDGQFIISKTADISNGVLLGKFLGISQIEKTAARKILLDQSNLQSYANVLSRYLPDTTKVISVQENEADEVDTPEDYQKVLSNRNFKITKPIYIKENLVPGLAIKRFVGVYDVFGARLAQMSGLDGLFLGSFQISISQGKRDDYTYTLESTKSVVRAIRESANHMPIILDGLSGFADMEEGMQAADWINEYKVAAICIDDQNSARNCSLYSSFSPELLSFEDYKHRLDIARACLGSRCKIIARTEIMNMQADIMQAKERLQSLDDIGADIILPHYIANDFEYLSLVIRDIELKTPLMIIPSNLLSIPLVEWRNLGFDIVVYANLDIRARTKAVNDIYGDIILSQSVSEPRLDNLVGTKYFENLYEEQHNAN